MTPATARGDAGLPSQAGIGFKPQHLPQLLGDPAPPGFVEIHAENYMGDGGEPHAWLSQARDALPLSVHGVGLSLGGDEPPDPAHLDRLAGLIERYRPALFSEHLAWSSHGGTYYDDLLPLRYDTPTLLRVCAHIDAVQSRLRLRLCLENPSVYLAWSGSTFHEADFLAEIVRRTGCALLLDVNNLYVSARNLGTDPLRYLAALPMQAVAEIHLAGHAEELLDDGTRLLIDDHGAQVHEAVWALYARALELCGPVPTLIEWDTDVPVYETLRAQARRAQALLDTLPAMYGQAA